MHGIVCNKQLKRYKISNSDLCTFCDEEVETALHLFTQCEVSLIFYTRVRDFIKDIIPNADIKELSRTQIIFNEVNNNLRDVCNLILLLAKYHV